jgi:hypothetical protein
LQALAAPSFDRLQTAHTHCMLLPPLLLLLPTLPLLLLTLPPDCGSFKMSLSFCPCV